MFGNSSQSSESSGSLVPLQSSCCELGRYQQVNARKCRTRKPTDMSPACKPRAKPAALVTPKILKQVKMVADVIHTPKNAAISKKIGPKAISMEDLTPKKRCKERKGEELTTSAVDVRIELAPELESQQRRAALKIFRFMLVSAWRRRRDEVRCLRRTLECQMSCSERLRLQTYTLKSLLESDNKKVKVALRELERLKKLVREKEQERQLLVKMSCSERLRLQTYTLNSLLESDNNKVRVALRELERLKPLVRDKEQERQLLVKEKRALEQDVLGEQDRASQLQIAMNNYRDDLEVAKCALAEKETLLAAERDGTAMLRSQLIQALEKASSAEEEAARLAGAVERAEQVADALREETIAKEQLLEVTLERLEEQIRLRARTETDRAALAGRVSDNALDTGILKLKVRELQAEVARLAGELQNTRDRLACWPASLTRVMVMTRSWLRNPISLREALWWSVLPARRGC